MSTTVPGFDPAEELNEVQAATDRFLASVVGLDAEALAAPSLLPGWTRGHVCSHLANNADSLVNLLTWARTGVETPAYPPGDARDQAIEAGASRSADEHVEALSASAERFSRAVARHPEDRWDTEVTCAAVRSHRFAPCSGRACARWRSTTSTWDWRTHPRGGPTTSPAA